MLEWKSGRVPACAHAQEMHKGHGRVERRMLLALEADPRALGWPGAARVVLLRRERQAGRQEVVEEYHCGVTSLGPARADAAALLAMVRGHWGIENRLFHVRDATFGEDACRVRSGAAPQVLAALRNAAVTLLNAAGWGNKAAALRRHAAHYTEALALLAAPDG